MERRMCLINKNDERNEIKEFIANAKKLKEKDREMFTKILYLMKGIHIGKTDAVENL